MRVLPNELVYSADELARAVNREVTLRSNHFLVEGAWDVVQAGEFVLKHTALSFSD